ncbi:MAG: 4-hydroxy-tetrahydrodipicolinate reductase [Clostridia bacterium]|nr:4-hydroxy-tetrahydrodipicolinate reductase [Clostridia bacterium]
MLNVLINGAHGRMGQEVFNQIKQNNNFNVICGYDIKEDLNNVFPIYNNLENIQNSADIDVIIDFSTPEASLNILGYACENNIPIVIATTGFSEDQLLLIEKFSKDLPIFKSANMSFEVCLMSKIVAELAVKLKDSDIEIIETHHNKKIDSPSGTALILADSINKALDNEMYYEYNRHSKKEKRSKKEIGIHSIRGGTEVGKHTVAFYGENESFEITHNVTSRSIFANGTLKAAEFIVKQKNGLYNMDNLV